MTFKPVTPTTRSTNCLRVAFAGEPDSGKTYTALEFLTAMLGPDVDHESKLAVIDTESAADLYGAGDPFRFSLDRLTEFHPNNIVRGIHDAQGAGFDALLIDSASDPYVGKGGVLSMVQQKSNQLQGWGKATTPHTQMINEIANADMHVAVTLRVRVDEKGIAHPVQRADFLHAFHIGLLVDAQGMTVFRSRCSLLRPGQRIPRDGAALAETLRAWLKPYAPGDQNKGMAINQRVQLKAHLQQSYGRDEMIRLLSALNTRHNGELPQKSDAEVVALVAALAAEAA